MQPTEISLNINASSVTWCGVPKQNMSENYQSTNYLSRTIEWKINRRSISRGRLSENK